MFTALVAEATAVLVIQKLEASQLQVKQIVWGGHVWQCFPRLIVEDVQILENWSGQASLTKAVHQVQQDSKLLLQEDG